MKTILIDHDDSFTFILAHYLGMASGKMPIILNHKSCKITQIKKLKPTHIVLSPGPGNPTNKKDFAIGNEIIENFDIPILGICLGHQGIAAHFGATIHHTKQIMHGRKSVITHNKKGLFRNISSPLTVMRYHSLAVYNLPNFLSVDAKTEDGEIMAFSHKKRPIFGLQFHPESIGTEHGLQLIQNFYLLRYR